MPTRARVSAPDIPYHVLQRGNRRQQVFFTPEDKELYLKILSITAKEFALEIWAYCLMGNHVHLVVCPRNSESLTRGIGETHRLYTRMINFRQGWRGFLWQGRFKSFPMNDRYVHAVVRYVERNPVRAGLVRHPQEYEWSSAKAHILNQRDGILTRFFLQEEIVDWKEYLDEPENSQVVQEFRVHGNSCRPLMIVK